MGNDPVQRYPSIFNQVGEEYGLRWRGDENKNGEMDVEEVEVMPSFETKHPEWNRLAGPERKNILRQSITTVWGQVNAKGVWFSHEATANLGPRPSADAERKLGTDLYKKLVEMSDHARVILVRANFSEGGHDSYPVEATRIYSMEVLEFVKNSHSDDTTKKAAARAMLGYLFYRGVLTLDESSRVRVDFERTPVVAKDLGLEIYSALESGSQEKAQAILAYAEHIPQGWSQKVVLLIQK